MKRNHWFLLGFGILGDTAGLIVAALGAPLPINDHTWNFVRLIIEIVTFVGFFFMAVYPLIRAIGEGIEKELSNKP